MKPLKLKPAEPTEAQVLKSILRYLANESAVAWAWRFNTGAHAVEEPGGRRRYVRYGFPGCSDILGQMRTGHLLAIECKRPSARRRLTPPQRAFLETVARNGGLALMAASIEEVQWGIRKFLAEKSMNTRESSPDQKCGEKKHCR